jgi:argininosuccinate lyase
MSSHLWGGRFREALADIALRFSSSIALDGRLYREDIAGSIAHAQMLGATGVIAPEESRAIVDGLRAVNAEIEDGSFVFTEEMEDVHLAIERRLTELIGPVGGKLHTARSRNDQVAVDERLYLKREIEQIRGAIAELMEVLVDKAAGNAEVVMPGYTHMQRAQPVLLAHHLLAYVAMLGRDHGRMGDCLARLDRSPLGAAALAGTPFPIDRAMTAGMLGFAGIVDNSIDAVSDRDYLIEFASACSIAMMHLSRLAEELVLWSSVEFRFVSIGDAYTTGSSIMPQKKNPDMAELVRGKTGRVYGALFNLLTIMKGLPLAYNRDMQEDKMPMLDLVETLGGALAIFADMLRHTTFRRERLETEAAGEFSTATEVADYLVRAGVPFRDAHAIAGSVVRHCIDAGITLDRLDLDGFRLFSSAFGPDIVEYLTPRGSVERKSSAGSTSPSEVARQIAAWRDVLAVYGAAAQVAAS